MRLLLVSRPWNLHIRGGNAVKRHTWYIQDKQTSDFGFKTCFKKCQKYSKMSKCMAFVRSTAQTKSSACWDWLFLTCTSTTFGPTICQWFFFKNARILSPHRHNALQSYTSTMTCVSTKNLEQKERRFGGFPALFPRDVLNLVDCSSKMLATQKTHIPQSNLSQQQV